MSIQRKLLANLPTPLAEVEFRGAKFRIKRDDLTGSEVSGNKIRKLEFIIADAQRKNKTKIYACGGIQSNFCRAAVAAAVMSGLQSRVYLKGSPEDNDSGNHFLQKLFGAEIIYLTAEEYKEVDSIMTMDAMEENAYVIPLGGSTPVGTLGYVEFIKELDWQTDTGEISGVISALGSGGTTAGMLLGAALYAPHLKIYGVSVAFETEIIREKVISLSRECAGKYYPGTEINEENLVIIDNFPAEGYDEISLEKLELLSEFARSTGILLDPVYTGKAFYSFYKEFLSGSESSDIIFLHTGGIFGALARYQEYPEL